MHKRTLILHIGMHKTGSSALQLALLKHKTDDYEFVFWDKFGNSSNIVKCEMERYSIIVPRLEKLLDHTSSNKVVLSAEHLFFLEDATSFKVLHSILSKHFEDIQIYVYLRRQDKAAISFKQQASKGRIKNQMPSSRLIGHEDNALPQITTHIFNYLNYFEKLEKWAGFFGRDNIHVRNFDKRLLIDRDIIADFSQWAKLDGLCLQKNVNSGVCRNISLINHKMLEMDFPPLLIDYIRKKNVPDNIDVTCSRQEAVVFYENFRECNEKLIDKNYLTVKNDFQNEFDCYPLQSNYNFNAEHSDFLMKSLLEYIDDK